MGGYYTLDIESFLRTDKLGRDSISVFCKDIDKFNEAVCYINEVCGDEVNRRRKNEVDDFILNSYRQITQNIKDPIKVREILESIYELGKGE